MWWVCGGCGGLLLLYQVLSSHNLAAILNFDARGRVVAVCGCVWLRVWLVVANVFFVVCCGGWLWLRVVGLGWLYIILINCGCVWLRVAACVARGG